MNTSNYSWKIHTVCLLFLFMKVEFIYLYIIDTVLICLHIESHSCITNFDQEQLQTTFFNGNLAPERIECM